jgi:hypothetical protein
MFIEQLIKFEDFIFKSKIFFNILKLSSLIEPWEKNNNQGLSIPNIIN